MQETNERRREGAASRFVVETGVGWGSDANALEFLGVSAFPAELRLFHGVLGLDGLELSVFGHRGVRPLRELGCLGEFGGVRLAGITLDRHFRDRGLGGDD